MKKIKDILGTYSMFSHNGNVYMSKMAFNKIKLLTRDAKLKYTDKVDHVIVHDLEYLLEQDVEEIEAEFRFIVRLEERSRKCGLL